MFIICSTVGWVRFGVVISCFFPVNHGKTWQETCGTCLFGFLLEAFVLFLVLFQFSVDETVVFLK